MTTDTDHILKLAEIVREVDGNHRLGAAALAEAILSHPGSRWSPAVKPEGPSESDVTELFYRYVGEGDEVGFENAIEEALARWGRPAVKPVPVSERLPGPEDCMDEGWAWFYTPRGDWIKAVLPVSPAYTHWLPHYALPIPPATKKP